MARDLSPKTIRNTLAFLSMCYDEFIDNDILKMSNPCARVKTPARNAPEKLIFSMINAMGADLLEISNQLGHSDKTTTLNIYEHLFEDENVASRKIASDIDNLFKADLSKKSK